MSAVGMCEQTWIPVHIDDIKEVDETIVINPEDAIVEHLRTLGVEI